MAHHHGFQPLAGAFFTTPDGSHASGGVASAAPYWSATSNSFPARYVPSSELQRYLPVPPPSQAAADRFWDTHGGTLVGGLLVGAGVVLGSVLLGRRIG